MYMEKKTETLPALRRALSPIMKEALGLQVTSAKEHAVALAHLKALKGVATKVKTEKEKMLSVLRAAVEVERERWRPIEQELGNVKEVLEEKVLTFVEADTKRQQQQEAKIIMAGYKKQETVMAKIAAVDEAVSEGVRTIKELHIFDVTLIPREFLVVDETAVRKALREGIAVPGAELVDKKTIVIR